MCRGDDVSVIIQYLGGVVFSVSSVITTNLHGNMPKLYLWGVCGNPEGGAYSTACKLLYDIFKVCQSFCHGVCWPICVGGGDDLNNPMVRVWYTGAVFCALWESVLVDRVYSMIDGI